MTIIECFDFSARIRRLWTPPFFTGFIYQQSFRIWFLLDVFYSYWLIFKCLLSVLRTSIKMIYPFLSNAVWYLRFLHLFKSGSPLFPSDSHSCSFFTFVRFSDIQSYKSRKHLNWAAAKRSFSLSFHLINKVSNVFQLIPAGVFFALVRRILSRSLTCLSWGESRSNIYPFHSFGLLRLSSKISTFQLDAWFRFWLLPSTQSCALSH